MDNYLSWSSRPAVFTMSLLSLFITATAHAMTVNVNSSVPVTRDVMPQLRAANGTLTEIADTQRQVGAAINANGEKVASMIEQAEQSRATQDSFARQSERLEESRRSFAVPETICTESTSGSAAGDIDLSDVLHNDRTLVVLIPALELSKSESANLGKLYISAKRMVIARDLGYQLEGKSRDVLTSAKFYNPFPFPDVHDELGSYFAPGMDDLAAQMRSLGVMLVISAQDIQRFVAQFKGEYQTVNANTLVKWFMAMQDEKDTFELAKATAGKDYYAELGEMKRTPGTVSSSYEEANTTYIREKNRITLDELKDLNPGEGFISFKSALVPGSAIYIPDSEKISSKLSLRINRFIDTGKPTEADLVAQNPHLRRLLPPSELEVSMLLQRTDEIIAGSETHTLPPLMDPILARLMKVALDLDNRCDISYTPTQRGILLFEAARDVLKKRGKKWFTVKTQPNPLRVSDVMAHRLARKSTAFMPREQ